MTFTSPHLLDSARWENRRVGLLGGSFNPAHAGHLHISLIALHALKLDFVWWLVTPQNPLKKNFVMADYEERLEDCRAITAGHDPRIMVTDLERQLGVNRSWDTIRGLKRLFPRTPFVWITGMDNALSFHRWYRWQDILKTVATAHIARPPALTLIENCPLKMLAGQNHHWIDGSRKADLSPRNTYWLLQRKMVGLSSTGIRNNLDFSGF